LCTVHVDFATILKTQGVGGGRKEVHVDFATILKTQGVGGGRKESKSPSFRPPQCTC